MENILSVNGLQISFTTPSGEAQAVRGINLQLFRGETLAIVGESGSGKSVTARAIMGILAGNAQVKGGEIFFEGKNLLALSEQELCELRGDKIAMIFQDPSSSLNPIMRVGRQLTEAMLLKNKRRRRLAKKEGKEVAKLTKEEAKKRAIELMREVGIRDAEKRYREYPFELSGGMRQRIVIAIALSSDPELLICDEPTTALDVTIQAQILDLIERVKAERGLTVLFITHDLGVVARVADRVAVMYAGKVVEVGRADEIFYSPAHPYTWALLSSMPDLNTSGTLEAISGTPPNLLSPICGDAFAPRNPYAMRIDFEREPPVYQMSETHFASTWLLHPDAPKIELPKAVQEKIDRRGKAKG